MAHVPQVASGELLVIVGSVGAGKSSLLAGILGEMLLSKVCIPHAAFVPARKWLGQPPP